VLLAIDVVLAFVPPVGWIRRLIAAVSPMVLGVLAWRRRLQQDTVILRLVAATGFLY
jgi:hypothetical protein